MASSEVVASAFDRVRVVRDPAEVERLRKMRDQALAEYSKAADEVVAEGAMEEGLKAAIEHWLASKFFLIRPFLRIAVRRYYRHIYEK